MHETSTGESVCARLAAWANRSKLAREPVDRAEREVEDRVVPVEGEAATAYPPWHRGILRRGWRRLDLEDDLGEAFGHGVAPGSVSGGRRMEPESRPAAR